MYDDDLFNMLGSSYTTTETERETENETVSQYNPYSTSSPYIDDYSSAQNFEEEKSYNSFSNNFASDDYSERQTEVRKMHVPTIQKQAEAVTLTKKREKLYFSSRLKVATVVFSIIFAAIVFVAAWNFAQAGRLMASLDAQKYEISQLEQNINQVEVTYNGLKDDFLSNPNSGYVAKEEGVNYFKVSLDEFYVEPEIEKIQSNWFNDVCEFFSQMFA